MTRVLPYLPVEELEGRPHVIVDGAARSGSVLTLSHWPQSPTPVGLARDLSAEIVFAFLRASRGGGVALLPAGVPLWQQTNFVLCPGSNGTNCPQIG